MLAHTLLVIRLAVRNACRSRLAQSQVSLRWKSHVVTSIAILPMFRPSYLVDGESRYLDLTYLRSEVHL